MNILEEKDDFSIKVYNSIETVDKELWEKGLEPKDYYNCYDFLKIVEFTTLDIDKYYYIMIFRNNVKIANIVLFSIKLDLANLAEKSYKAFINKIQNIWNNSFKMNVLFCGLPISSVDNSIRIFNTQYLKKCIDILSDQIRIIIKQESTKMVFIKDFNDDDRSWADYFISKSFKIVRGLPSNNFYIKWRSFDQYIESLRKKYRNPLKNVLKKQNDLNINIHTENRNIFTDTFYKLYIQVNESAEFQLEKLRLDFFDEILNQKKIPSFLITIHENESLLGHVTIIETDNSLVPLFLGYDKYKNKDYDIYFNLVYKIMELGIEKNKDVIKFGQTADFFKQKLGCKSENVWLYIYLKSPLLRSFTKSIFSKLFPKIKNYELNIFKS